MGLKTLLSTLFVIIAAFLFIAYWFIPFNTTVFSNYKGGNNFNFSINSSNDSMQFYNNLRFSSSNISYDIVDCPLYKENDIRKAFAILQNITVLSFYSVESNGDISAFCTDRTKPSKNGFFVAGEGGPVNITKLLDFNLISHGEITLIKESQCNEPKIAIHEILHALGFKHSSNPDSIMYPTSNCNQEIGQDIINKIKEVYSYPSYPDLSFENVSAVMHGRYLDANISIRNNGFVNSNNGSIIIFADNKFVKEFNLKSIKAGYGIVLSVNNVAVNKLSVNELEFEINYPYSELKKTNNKIKLEIKN